MIRTQDGASGPTQWWERFWFAEVPPELYALLRIAVGAVGFVALLSFLPVSMFWAVDGIAPLPEEGTGLRLWIYEAGLSGTAGWFFFLLLATAFACMAVGLFTNTAIVICFFGSVFQAHWNSVPLSSAHTALVAALFSLVWADCGAVLSLDARRGRAAGPAAVQAIWPLQLLRIQISVLYFSSGIFKFLGPLWRDGSVIYWAVNHNIYARFPEQPPLTPDWGLALGAYITLVWELGFPLFMIHPWTRLAAIVVGVLVHLGIWATLEVGPFTWVMMASYLAFLDPGAVSRFIRRRTEVTPGSPAVAIRHSPDEPGNV